ncbi:MAG: TonB-dependent receptor, partial [Pseudomonadota bacterium]
NHHPRRRQEQCAGLPSRSLYFRNAAHKPNELDEDVNAFYLMSRMDFGQLRLVYGLRYESTDYDSVGQRIVLDDVGGDGSPVAQAVSFSDDYDYVLPSINLRYAFTDELILRAAYYETFARPSFDDLAPGGEIEFEEDDGETEFAAELGNPLLEPLEARSVDLSLEWYDQGIGLLAAGLFYKDLDNFIVLADTADQIDLTQFVGNAVINDAEVIQPINGESADLLGLELTWVKKFTGLPGFWSGLLLSANATFTDSEADLALRPSSIDLPRQSDRVFNLTVGYESQKFSARLAGTYKSEALLGLEEPDDPRFDVYQDEHVQLDLSLKYHVSENMLIYLDANNLTDEPFYAYFDRPRYNAQYEEYGRTFALGIQYRAR